MLNNLRSVHLPSLVAILSFILSIGAAGLWYVRRTTGRPIREMLALLAAAFVLIAFMFPLVVCADEWLSSPDLAIHDLAKKSANGGASTDCLFYLAIFNRLAQPKQKANSHGKGRYHDEPIA